MWADFDRVERQTAAQMRIHGIDLLAAEPLARDVRLVRRDDEAEAMPAQPAQGFGGIRYDDHLVDGVGRIGFAVSDIGFVQHTIPVEENGPGHTVAGAFSTPSHFVCLALSAG